MGLIGNYSVVSRYNTRSIGSGLAFTCYRSASPVNADKNRFVGGFSPYFGAPVGYLHPMSYLLPLKPGAMRAISNSTSTSSAIGAAGRNIVSTGVGLAVGATTAQAIVQIITSGYGTSSSSALAAAVISLITSGSATSSGSTLLGAVINIEPSGASVSSGQTIMTAIGHIVTEGGGSPELSPQGLALSLLDDNDIETGYSMRESLRLILSALSGKVSGAGGAVISIRDVNDTIDRIIATVDANGNRTSVTLNKD